VEKSDRISHDTSNDEQFINSSDAQLAFINQNWMNLKEDTKFGIFFLVWRKVIKLNPRSIKNALRNK